MIRCGLCPLGPFSLARSHIIIIKTRTEVTCAKILADHGMTEQRFRKSNELVVTVTIDH